MNHWITLLTALLLTQLTVFAQQSQDSIPLKEWSEPQEYEIGGIKISGAFNSDESAIKSVAGLRVGDRITIPGPDITRAILNLWKLRLFTDVQIIQEKIIGETIFLNIYLQERSRLSRYAYTGVPKSTHEDLNDVVKPFLIKGQIVSEDTKMNAVQAIEKYYRNKGFHDVEVIVVESAEKELKNAVILEFDIKKNNRVKIAQVMFTGNENVKSGKLKKLMKHTKAKSKILAKSKLVTKDYKEDKQALVAYYNTIGYRDMEIIEDSIWRDEKGQINIHMMIDEGQKYYFRDITWKGNSIHTDERLSTILGIKKGDVYDDELLENRLRFSLDGRDVSSLYLDDGYLFFDVRPVEVAVENDSIDIEMRIFEGPQATIDQVIIEGNDRTHEHVIRREIRTTPGQKFSRSDIIRSQRQILNLGYFDQEKFGIETPVDQARGTVDIIYKVEERPSDQLELSAGWGGFGRSRVIGTLGVVFNNFSLRNILNREAWHPLPQGDGQKLSMRAQTNGDFYQSYNFSFTEPWLGGKKPTSFTVGAVRTAFNNEFFNGGKLAINRGFAGIGTRLRWPDDNFIVNAQVALEALNLEDYTSRDFVDKFGNFITDGSYNNFSLALTLSRNTISEPIFPRSGSNVSLTAKLTPPYTTLFGRDFDMNDPQSLYKFVEYHKWRIDAEWYAPLGGKFVLKTAAKMGFLGYFNNGIGTPPFERFELGGDGISNQRFGITGKDIISLRSYDPEDIVANNLGGASIFNKFTVELRYPISLNPSTTIFGLAFLEGGNSWTSFDAYNPFDLRRSAGVGVRVFLPMFGLLGFDYGWGWDKPTLIANDAKWSEFGKFSLILGFEPD
ncbi:MAG TPA: outer membrane protein assembly factor BamA [Saprospiraceae bacterium]|nr:outer membrane protein assembly factor BamA [Saprospiraceae bacterium]